MQAAPAPATDTETPDPRRAFLFFCSRAALRAGGGEPAVRRKVRALAALYEATRRAGEYKE